MAFLGMVLKKITRGIGLVLCLLAGLIIAVALISSVPVYTGGMMERTLKRELTDYQLNMDRYPGSYSISWYFSDDAARTRIEAAEDKEISPLEDESVKKVYAQKMDQFTRMDEYVQSTIAKERVLPIQAQALYRCTSPYRVEREEYAGLMVQSATYGKLQSMSDLYDHITLVDGDMPSQTPVEGVYEVLVTSAALQYFDIPLNTVLVLTDQLFEDKPPLRVRPVGVFNVKDPEDLYWTGFHLSLFRDGLLMDESLFADAVLSQALPPLSQMRWFFAQDYTQITNLNSNALLHMYTSDFRELRDISPDVTLDMPAREVIARYAQKQRQVKTMMLPQYLSVFIMLCLYLCMVSRLIVDKERNEIALVASRGARKSQILSVYLAEFILLCLIAVLGGPLLGLCITKVLGASSGFLSFVSRKALPVRLSGEVYLYGGAGMALSLLMLLIPAWSASKTNIVAYKQQKNRFMRWTMWERVFLDVILLAVSAGGFFLFQTLGPLFSMISGGGGLTGPLAKLLGPVLQNVDTDAVIPLLFVVPSLCILGLGLLFIRVYPLLLRGVYRLGRGLWPPAAYHVLNRVSKGFRNYHFLMIFLIMTLSTGIFSATAARTINQNDIDRAYYRNGADMVISTKWEDNSVSGPGGVRQTVGGELFQYREPPFTPFTALPGVEAAAKVRTEDVHVRASGDTAGVVKLMGIEPYPFSQTAWYRAGLMPYHINEYLGLLLEEPSACLVYRAAAEAAGVRVGDTVEVVLNEHDTVAFTVYALIDYWPAFNPNEMELGADVPALMVANLSYIQKNMPLCPWDVWLRLTEGAKSADIYAALKDQGVPVLSVKDTRQEVIAMKNESFRLATNGILTLSFLICGLICLIGFVIFWILAMQSRVLEFSILRSMGLSTGTLIGMMAIEQVLTSLAASIAGICIGLITSKVFVPFFQIAYSTADQVPGFRIVSAAEDRVRIYLFVGVILAAGLGILGFMLRRINVNQALKLGED